MGNLPRGTVPMLFTDIEPPSPAVSTGSGQAPTASERSTTVKTRLLTLTVSLTALAAYLAPIAAAGQRRP